MAALFITGRKEKDTGRSFFRDARSFFHDLAAYLRSLAHKGNGLMLALLALICVAGISLRLYFWHHPIRYDEAINLNIASQPLRHILTHYETTNNQILHTILVHFCIRLFGDGIRVMRLPALVAGTLLIPASFILADVIYDRYTGLLAAGLVATSSLLVEYSVLARGYTTMILLFLLLFVLAAYLLRKDRGGRGSLDSFS